MERFKRMALKWGGLVASLALFVGVNASTQFCWFWFHQPEVPQGMEKFKK